MIAQVMHLPYLRSLPSEFEITAICDFSPGVLNHVGEQYGIASEYRFTDYRELVASDVDAVFVLVNGSHGPATLAALVAGKHVFVEKPLCFTLREADEIAAAVRQSRATLMVGYMKRFDPGYRYGQQLVRAMDDVRYVQINTLHPSEGQYIDIHGVFRCDDVASDVMARAQTESDVLLREAVGDISPALQFVYFDVFLSSMVHDINALRHLVDGPHEVLFTEIWPADSRTPSVTTMLRHAGGMRTCYTWTYLDEVRDYFEEIAVLSATRRVRIQFPSPFLKNWPTPVVVQHMAGGALVEQRVQVSYLEAFREELRAFHEYVDAGAQPPTGVADAREDIAVLQRILAAFAPPGLGGEAARQQGVPAGGAR